MASESIDKLSRLRLTSDGVLAVHLKLESYSLVLTDEVTETSLGEALRNGLDEYDSLVAGRGAVLTTAIFSSGVMIHSSFLGAYQPTQHQHLALARPESRNTHSVQLLWLLLDGSRLRRRLLSSTLGPR